MRRRSFLKTVASAVPSAGMQNFLVTQALAQAPSSPAASALHVVGNGEDYSNCPHSLGFSSILFKVPIRKHLFLCRLAPEHAGDADFMSRYELERVGPSPFWKPQTS